MRPTPVRTSSAITSMPLARQISARRFQAPRGGTMMPPAPAIGSKMTAAGFSWPEPCRRSSAASMQARPQLGCSSLRGQGGSSRGT